MKNILFVIPQMNTAGTEKALLGLINLLPSDKYRIEIRLVKAQGGFLGTIPKNVIVDELPLPDSVREALMAGGAGATIRNYIKKFKLISAAKVFINKTVKKQPVAELIGDFDKIEPINETYDLAVCYTMHFPFIVRYVAEKVNAKKKAVWIHNDFSTTGLHPEYMLRDLECYDRIFAVSKQLKDEFVERCPVLSARTELFYNIVDADGIKAAASAPAEDFDFEGIKLLTVGRLNRQKGLDILIKAAEMLKNDGLVFRWYIIGGGELRSMLETEIKKRKLSSYVVLLGVKNNPYPYFAACDIYVQPSRHEGYCTTVNEARVLNKPVVATCVAGTDEMIEHEKTGLICGISPEEVYRAVSRMIIDKKLREEIIANLKAVSFSNSRQFDRFAELVSDD